MWFIDFLEVNYSLKYNMQIFFFYQILMVLFKLSLLETLVNSLRHPKVILSSQPILWRFANLSEMPNWISVELHANLGIVSREHLVVLSGRSQVKLKGSTVGFVLSFFWVLLELDIQSETREIWTFCKVGLKGGFWKQTCTLKMLS